MRALPSIQKLWQDNKDKGLNVFLFETDGTSADKLFGFMMERGITVPTYVGAPPAYKGDGSQPYHYVIGVDGRVVFEGHGNWQGAVEAELKKIKYPGLGKHNIAKGAEKAADFFAKRNYVKAIEEANKILEKEKTGPNSTDAQYIIDRCNWMMERLQARAEKAVEDKDYLAALAALDHLAAGFKGDETGTKAAARAKELKDDKDIKKEIDAQAEFIKKQEELKKPAAKSAKAKILRDWAATKKFEGTKAVEDARALARRIEAN